MNTPVCPKCKAPMVQRKSKFPGRPFFWGCRNFPDCTYRIGAHPSGEPLGIPADEETRQARIKAHEAFDKVWKEWGYTRREAYSLLAMVMGMTELEAHIGNFTKEQCEILIKKVDQIYYGEVKLKNE